MYFIYFDTVNSWLLFSKIKLEFSRNFYHIFFVAKTNIREYLKAKVYTVGNLKINVLHNSFVNNWVNSPIKNHKMELKDSRMINSKYSWCYLWKKSFFFSKNGKTLYCLQY